MRSCTKIVRKRMYREVVPAGPNRSAKWAWIWFFDHCRKPAIDSREETAWCDEHSGKNASTDDA